VELTTEESQANTGGHQGHSPTCVGDRRPSPPVAFAM